ncbi:MAG: hypothetical protein HYX84_03645 [Chloroflexi bacterium]|nr:hypothetical protein [Chloroflexota bacterium]
MLHKALRGIGIALILMPEPLTTAVGIVLLGIVYLLPRSNKFVSQRYLHGLIKFYLNQTRPRSQPGKIIHHSLKEKLADYNLFWQPPAVKKVTRHVIDDERLRLKYGMRQQKPVADMSNQLTGAQETAGSIVHHSLASRWSTYDWLWQPRASHDRASNRVESHQPERHPYGSALAYPLNQAAGNPKSGTPRKADKIIHHSLIHSLSGYVLPSVPLMPKKAVEHKIDISKLQRYYEGKLAELAGHG